MKFSRLISILLIATAFSVSAVAQKALTADTQTAQKINAPEGKKRVKSTISVKSMIKSQEGFSVDVANDSDQPLKILGVQSSTCLFVVDFDKSVAPGKTGHVVVDYEAQSAATGSSEYLRLRTNLGIRLVEVAIDRPTVVTFSKSELVWAPGSPPATQSVSVTIANRAAVIQEVKAQGLGNNAVLADLGNGKYRIDITPKKTEVGENFPVLITFNPEIPGAPRAIICSVKQTQ